MVSEAVSRTLHDVLNALNKLNLPSAVMGGLAVAVWNHFRSTKDVDLLVGLTDDDPSDILLTLNEYGFQPKHDPPVLTIEGNRIIQLVYEPPDAFLEIQIDLFLADSPFQRSALSRRLTLRLPHVDQDVAVIGCEDLIVLKLLAGRVIDWADAAALLRINRASLDMDYLTDWIRRLDLGRDFAEIWGEAYGDEAVPP